MALTKPFQFQREDYAIYEQMDGRVLDTSQVGLGKTFKALLWARRNPQARPIVTVCPASLKWQWQEQAEMHIGMRAEVVEGIEAPKGTNKLGVVPPMTIINYDILTHRNNEAGRNWVDHLKRLKPKLVILDEGHVLGNRNSARSRAAMELCEGVPHVIVLTATPIMNRRVEMWVPLNILNPKVWKGFFSFGHRYCGPKKNDYGAWEFKGVSNTPKFRRLLKTCFPYDTLVETDIGSVSIGDVVENEMPIRVKSVDLKTSEVQWRSIQAYSSRTPSGGMLRIKHEAGEFTCTPDHLVWTPKGWKRAENLVPGSMLRMLQDQGDNFSKRFQKILQHQMCCNSSRTIGGIQKEDGSNDNRVSLRDGNQGMSPVHQGILCTTIYHDPPETQILQRPLRSSVENIPPIRSHENKLVDLFREKEGRQGECCPQKEGQEVFERKTQTAFRSSETCLEKSHPGVSKVSGSQSDIETTKDSSHGFGLEGRIFGKSDRGQKTKRSIQKRRDVHGENGSGIPPSEVSNRSGWPLPWQRKTTEDGSKEGETLAETRVVSVEILESGSGCQSQTGGDQDKVYDIQVEKNHNFFANGILVHNCMVRRLKKDVIDQLPEKVRTVVPVKLPDRKEYDHAMQNFRGWLAQHKPGKGGQAEGLMRITYLLGLIAKLKMPLLFEWIDNFLAESSGKLLVAANHTDVINQLKERYGDISVVINGAVSGEKRKNACKRFQNDAKVRLLFGQMKAAGVGLNLTRAEDVLFAEMAWNPATMIQFEGRCFARLGDVHGINVHYLVAKNTLESWLMKLNQRKQEDTNVSIDGAGADDDFAVYDSLMKQLNRKDLPEGFEL